MAFIKKLWKDRISQFPNRRTINDGNVTKQVTVGRDEGTITEPGDTFDASNMNDLEQRIEDAYGDVVSLVASEVAVQYHGDVIFDNVPTASHGVGYAVTSDGLKTALDGKANTSDIPDELNDLSDVNITSPTQGEALVFDADGNIVNGIPKLDVGDLDDVTITTPSNGDIIVYNNGTWVNVANPASTANFAPDYDDTATYNTNDKVIYNNLLYVCLDDNVTGAWDSTKWQQISTADYNASNLPISANDPTDTKRYIDTGLSGKQDSLSNQVITITPNTSILGNSGFTGACYQYGKIVCLFVQTASPTSEVAYQSIFLTGLPKPVYGNDNNRVSLTDRATNKPYRFRITDSGQLQEWYNSSGKIPSGADLYGTIVYLAE